MRTLGNVPGPASAARPADRTAVPSPSRSSRLLTAYVLSVALVTVSAIALGLLGPLVWLQPASPDWRLLILLGVAVVVMDSRATNIFGDSSISLSFVVSFAMGLVFGPGIAGAVSVVALSLAQPAYRKSWHKRIINSCVIPLSAMAGSALFFALTGGVASDHIIRFLPFVLPAALATYVGNSALVAIAVAITTGEHPIRVWRDHYRWLAPHYAAHGFAAYAMAVAYQQLGLIGIGIFALPVAMLWTALNQYASRARTGYEQLQAANAAIASREEQYRAIANRLGEANSALSHSEERFRSLVQNAPGFIAVLNADGTFQYLSPSLGSRTGAIWEHGVPSDIRKLVSAHDLPQVDSVMRDVLENPLLEATLELRLNEPDGSWHDYIAIVKNLLADPSVGGIVLNAHDVTERKELENQLRHQAFHDPLTELPNRALFLDRLTHALRVAERRSRELAVLFIDLDRFKIVNDSLGHAVGDALLVAAGNRILDAVGPGDTVARFGGDEFVILLEDVASREEANEAARRVLHSFSEPLQFEGHATVVTASVGVAVAADPAIGPRELIRRADVALFRAKEEGRGRVVVFDDAVDASSIRRFELESALREAVERDQLRLYYQPEFDLHTGRVVGFEALVRWEHPSRGLLQPGDFIPMAEETGTILLIGQWVLTEACRQARGWRDRFPALGAFTVSVNLSAKEFLEPEVVWRVASVLRDTGLAASMLRIEVTESILLGDTPAAQKLFHELKALGVEIAIDDFGTGYSSLNYLRRLPANVLKVDRSFVTDVDRDQRQASIVRAVVDVARALDMTVVAEGIERAEQAEILAEIGCSTAQGYYFAEPLAADALESWLREGSLGRGRAAAGA